MFVVVTEYNIQNRVSHLLDGFPTLAEATEAFNGLPEGAYPDAFACESPAQGGNRDWLADPVAGTLSYAPDIEIYKSPVIETLNALRDKKRNLPILSQGYVVQTGALNVGAMATDMFSASKNARVITSLTSFGNVATMVFQKNHHLKPGVSFPVSGADQQPYNVTAVVTVVDKKTISYLIAGPAVSPATGNITIAEATFKWVDDDNNIVYWTQDEVEEIVQACAEYLDECTLHGVELKNEVRACTTVAEIEAVDITTGWPDTGL